MPGPIEDYRTIGDAIGEILVIATVSLLVVAGLWIKLAGGASPILSFDAERVTSSAMSSFALDDTGQP